MEHNGVKPPMPQLRLPADYAYNPLYFVPNSNAVSEGGIGEDDAVEPLHRLSHAVLQATTYLHRPLHFSPSPSNATPVRSHDNRSRSRESSLTRRSGELSPAAASARRQRRSTSMAASHAARRRRGHALTQEVAAWQRRSGKDCADQSSVATPSQEVTADTMHADLSTSILRPTRATQLREDYVLHYIEERDEAAQNIFFRPKGWPLSGAALNSPYRQHCTSSASPLRNGFLTPTRPENSSAASLPTPRFTKAAQLRQQSAVQLMEKLERCELEKAAEEALAHVVAESSSRRALMRLRTGAHSNSSSRFLAVQRSGGARGASTAMPFSGTQPSHHVPRWHHTSRTGSSGDTINGAGHRIRATSSASTHSSPREEWLSAASTCFDDREKTLNKQQHAAEATHAPSRGLVPDAPAPLPSSKYRSCKISKEALKAPRGELSSAKATEAMAVLPKPAACNGGERVPSRHHRRRRCSYAAQRDSESLSPVAIRDVRDTAHPSPSTAALASPPAAVHREREQRGIRTPPAVRDTETKMTSRGDAPLAQRATSLTPSHLRDGDDASSSSVSSIMFTVLSAPQDDTAGAHLPEARHDWQQVATQGSRMRESGGAADDSSLEFRSTGRSDCEHSASLLACLTPVAAVPPSAMRGAECSSFTSPDFSRVPSPTQASASVTSDEARVSAATAVAAPHERETKTSCAEREVERTPHAVGANASLAPRRPLEQALQGTREEPSARSSARCLGRRGVCPPPVDAYPAPAHTPHTPSTERSGDVSRRSLSQDPYHAGSSISSRSGEFEAQPPSQSESTGRSAQVAATTLPQTVRSEVAEGDSEKEPSDAAEVRHEGSALSTQSSFASIASYHTEVHVHIPAVVSDAADESLEAATSQTELLAFYRIAKPSSAAVESRLHRRAEHDWSLKSNVRASSQGDEASRAGDDKQVLRGHGGAVPSSPSWLLNASEGISSALCGLVPSAASGESDASRSVATDAYTVVAGGGRRVLAAWSLPVPPTNCTHMVAAKEARQRAAVEAGLSKLCTASEQPSRLLSGHISDSRIRQLTAAGVNSASSYQPRRERPVGKEALDSPRKPSMQESSRCTSAPPSAAEAPSSLVVASAENGTRDDARPEVVADKAEALAHGKTTDDAPSAAVSLADVAVLGTDRKGDVDAPSVQREGGYPRDATQSLATVTVAAASEKSSLSLVGAEQPAAIENALAESLPVKDAPASRAVLSRSSCVAIGRENRPTEKAMGSLALGVDSVPPQSHAESIRSVQETGVFTSDGTVGSRTAVLASLPHPLSDTHAGAAVAKAEGRQNDVVPCDGAEAAPAPCIAKIRSATSSVRESAQPKEVSDIPLSVAAVQPEDATLHRSRSSSAEVGGANRAERTAVVGVNTPPSLSTWPRTVELAFATASFLTTEHGSFSLHFTEAEQSPRERSVYARQAASLSNGGGEELGEGVPHSHAPTPLHCRLPPQRRQATSPYEGVQLPDASAAEERKRDAPLAQAFSRSDTSTRCLCAASAEFQADVHVRAHTNERAEGTPAVPFGASVNGVSSVREQSRRAAAQDSVALDRSAPPSADATLELAAVCAPFSHDSPARPLSSSTSSSTHFLARSPSCSSQSSSSPTTPTATGRFMPSSLGRLDTPNQGDGGKVDFELRADDDCNGLLTGNAADANRSTFSRSTSCDLLEHAALVQLTEPTSTDAAVITTPFRPSSPVPGSEFSTTCSQISERITWSAGTWVDRERASASPDHAEAGVAESDLGVLRKGTRSAPSVPLTRVRYLNQDM
ncbi:hypothetical protein, unknown function [Leishmania donovani]|uniref:Uncharacterized protein n=1 Tax=Leishmania donovani TaxID=5661 RepID=E9BN84_LEIDO|nr:hypothetical protein, unknown function [Leishmania donovani]CBZ36712.1 hypothetical protein, unknown function [Leishmania donovani]